MKAINTERPKPDGDLRDFMYGRTKWYNYIGVVFLIICPLIALVVYLIWN